MITKRKQIVLALILSVLLVLLVSQVTLASWLPTETPFPCTLNDGGVCEKGPPIPIEETPPAPPIEDVQVTPVPAVKWLFRAKGAGK